MIAVSVIIPIYNCERYIQRCFSSLAEQTFRSFEAMVINDGSTDLSHEEIERVSYQYSEIPINYIKKAENNGQSYSMNLGIKEAKGNFVCFLDADDKIAPEFLASLYRKIEPSLDLVYCGFDTVFSETEIVKYEDRWKYLDDSKKIIDQYLNAKNHFAHTAAMYRKSFLLDKNIWYTETCRYSEDIEFMCKVLSNNPSCGSVHASLYYYFQRPNSITTNKSCDNIYDCTVAMRRANRVIPGVLGRVRFFLTRRAQMARHVVNKLYKERISKPTSWQMRLELNLLYGIYILMNPIKNMNTSALVAIKFFNKI